MPKSAKKKTTPKKRIESASPKTDKKTVKLPGYFRLTIEVFNLLWSGRRVFLRLIVLSWVASLLVIGVTQQARYEELSDMSEVLSEHFATGLYQALIEAGTVFGYVLGGSLTSSLSEGEQLYMGIIYMFVWLVVVWLLRHQLAGTSVKLRDGLYNAGAPLLTSLAIVVVGVIQLLPFALGLGLLTSLTVSGALSGWVAAVVLPVAVLLLGALTLYWLTTTFFAAIIVTIPGTYPLAALRSAKQLVAGQRVRVLLRMLWLLLVVLVVFSLVVIPFVVLDAVLNLSASAVVALVVQLVTISLFVYSAAYTYVLYRRIIDERTE